MKYLFLLSCSLVVAAPAAAQGAKPTQAAAAEVCDANGQECSLIDGARTLPETEITVLGTGQWDRIDQTGQPISVITSAEITGVQGPDLTRVLERLPGVTLARSGGLGSQTSLFVRGANSEQLLVLVDGVRVADVAAPSGGFDLGTLLPAGLSKIELLRGANSVAWGSDAMGGVLALTTAAPDGVTASAEYGAHDSLSTAASGGISGEGYQLGVDGGYTRTDGISAYAPGTEADPFRQWHVGGRGRLDLAADLALVATGRYADSKVDFDGYPAPLYAFADTPEYQTTRQVSGRTGLDYTGSSLSLAGGIAYSRTARDYFDPTFGSAANYTTQGRSLRADFTGRADLSDALRLTVGAESEWTRFATLFDPQRSARLSSGHALLGYHSGAINLTGGVRLDDHDRFGSNLTFGGNGSIDLGSGWRLRASYGEGFKAPSLYQLYGYGGNTALKPEQSRSYDAGVELGDRNAPLHFAATLFRRDSRQLISYVWPSGYFNTARARADGFELEGDAAVTANLRVRAAYSYVKAIGRDTGKDLARRPRHALSTSADWTTPLGLALGADLRLVGDSFDNAANSTRIDGHALVTLRASMPLGEHFELYGRIENVTDADYQTVADYGTYGRSAYAGVRLRW